MTRIGDTFKALQEQGKKGLIIYITGGCPDMVTTVKTVLAAEQAGADIVEIGIPFSDPMADGPVIQLAATMALQAGATVGKVLDAVKTIRQSSQIPIAFMTYVNPVLKFGATTLVKAAKDAGADGFIIPDLPLEECAVMTETSQQVALDFIQFVAPTTTPARMDGICRQAGGFIYCVSNTGVTGAREVDYSTLSPVIAAVRSRTSVPAAIGFGISSPAAAAQAARYAEAVIVGSAVMDRLMKDGVDAVASFVGELRRALDKKAGE